ncbi:hypothetical protein FWH09_01115 [Candidatus Saccharibacteria bacterium]|nr:hypothetical protein [Candidatus Saccharibacteria bacterium]
MYNWAIFVRNEQTWSESYTIMKKEGVNAMKKWQRYHKQISLEKERERQYLRTRNRDLIEAAARQQNVRLPWMYLALRIWGAIVWFVMFKVLGSWIALEPVYASADESRDLIPEAIKSKVVWISEQVANFARFTVFGEVYGGRFAYVVGAVENCARGISTIISLGSGSGLAEVIGLYRRRQMGVSLPKLILIDSSVKALGRAAMFASILGVSDYVECQRQFVGQDYKIPTDASKVMVISCGLAGNYFSADALRKLMDSLTSQENVVDIRVDFVASFLACLLKSAVGWGVMPDAEEGVGVYPRDEENIREFFADSENFSNEVESIDGGGIKFLKVARRTT